MIGMKGRGIGLVLIWLSLCCVGVLSKTFGDSTTMPSVILTPPDEKQRLGTLGYAISMQEDYFLLGRKRKDGGEAALYKKMSPTNWDLVQTVRHPKGDTDMGESALLMLEDGYIFAGMSHEHVNKRILDGHVYFWRLGISADGTEHVVDSQAPVRLEPDEPTERWGFHIDGFRDWLVITGNKGAVEMWSLATGTPVRKQKFKPSDVVPDFDFSAGFIIVEECNVNAEYIVCGIGTFMTEQPVNDEGALDLSLVDEKLEPYVVIFKLENGGWQISKRFKYSDIFGEPQGYFEMRRVHIGLDKDTNVAIAGFPEVPYIQWRGSDVRIELTGGRTAIMELNDETKEWESQELIFDDEDIPETKPTNFGISVDCNNLTCISCMTGIWQTTRLSVSTCYTYIRQDGKWISDKKLKGDDGCDPALSTCDIGFGGEVAIFKGTAVVASSEDIFIFDDVSEINYLTERDDNQWCFGADSVVTVRQSEKALPKEVRIDEVRVGDHLLSVNNVGKGVFSEVYMIEHVNDERAVPVLYIDYENEGDVQGRLSVTKNHLLAVPNNDRSNINYVTAKTLVEGSEIYVLGESMEMQMAFVTGVSHGYTQVRNVLTMNDHIVVNGVVASCMTKPFNVQPKSWHLLLSTLVIPFKLLYMASLRLPLIRLVYRAVGYAVWSSQVQ